MLTITIGLTEVFDEEQELFLMAGGTEVMLEHSLVSLSKWESKWEIPFLGDQEKTNEQTLDYIAAMDLLGNVSPEVLQTVTQADLDRITQYIDKKMTATWFTEVPGITGPIKKETVTAEIMYYWLVALTIPFETQEWHLNRLLTLVKVINAKNTPEKKSKTPINQLAAQRKALNDARKAQYGTAG